MAAANAKVVKKTLRWMVKRIMGSGSVEGNRMELRPFGDRPFARTSPRVVAERRTPTEESLQRLTVRRGPRRLLGPRHQALGRVLASGGDLAFRRRMLNRIANLFAPAILIRLRRRPMTPLRLWPRLRWLRPILRHRGPRAQAQD